jgi:hypothetical protein
MRSANGERNRPGGAILVTRPEGLRALGVRARRTKNLAKGRASDKFIEKECDSRPKTRWGRQFWRQPSFQAAPTVATHSSSRDNPEAQSVRSAESRLEIASLRDSYHL